MPAVPGFQRSANTPLFKNGPWAPGLGTVDVAGLPTVPVDLTFAGLCGGMSFLTRDIFEAGTKQLRNTGAARIPLELARYLLARLVESFDGGPVVARWLESTALPDHDTVVWGPGMFHQSVNECAAITEDIDNGILCPIGVVLVQSANPADVFHGHVELVYAYERVGDMLTLHTYDCNAPYPNYDPTFITLDVSSPTPAKPITTNGTHSPSRDGIIRGFFRLPYSFVDPAPAYIDGADMFVHTPPPPAMRPGEKAQVSIAIRNRGSTAWLPGEGYCLGSQSPQDSTLWGLSRVNLPELEPDQMTGVTFTITAPAQPGKVALSWRALREGAHWFGNATPPISVAVGLAPRATVPAVEGMFRDYALKAITQAGLKAKVTGTNDPNTYVDEQRPPEFSLVDPGSEVSIHLKAGSPP